MAASKTKGYNATIKIVNEETGEEKELSGLLGFSPEEPVREFPLEAQHVHGAKGQLEELEAYPALMEVLEGQVGPPNIRIEGLPPMLEGWRVTNLLQSPDAVDLPLVAALAVMHVDGSRLWALLEPSREQLAEILEEERALAETMHAIAVQHAQGCDVEDCPINEPADLAKRKLDRINEEIAKLEEDDVG